LDGQLDRSVPYRQVFESCVTHLFLLVKEFGTALLGFQSQIPNSRFQIQKPERPFKPWLMKYGTVNNLIDEARTVKNLTMNVDLSRI